MVLTDRIQKRIGLLFFIFSFLVLILNIGRSAYYGGFIGVLTLRNFSFILYPIIFGISVLYRNKILKTFQIACISIEGILTLVDSPSDVFFGLLFILISILLSYAYGYLDRLRALKGITISVSLVFLFSSFSLYDHQTPLLSSIMWVIFLWLVLFILWIIFKDYVEEYKNQVRSRECVLQTVIHDLTEKLDEYTEISHISLDANKELLQIVKKHISKEQRG